LRIAIASSIPPSYGVFVWKTCITTRGARPSREHVARVVEVRVGVVALPHLLDREVEDLRREPLGARSLHRLPLELEAGGERGLGDLELLGRRLGGREPVLELVAGAREGLRERLSGFRLIQPKSSVEAASAPS
jgi:hypothetical protein